MKAMVDALRRDFDRARESLEDFGLSGLGRIHYTGIRYCYPNGNLVPGGELVERHAKGLKLINEALAALQGVDIALKTLEEKTAD